MRVTGAPPGTVLPLTPRRRGPGGHEETEGGPGASGSGSVRLPGGRGDEALGARASQGGTQAGRAAFPRAWETEAG